MRNKLAIGVLGILFFALQVSAQKESVNPGINKSYLKEDLVVTDWIERFESEGREVYDNRHTVIEKIGLKSGMNVADIGTGTGIYLPLFAEEVKPSGKVFAVDIVADFLDHIDRQIEQNNWKHVETVLCSERSVKLPENSIDVAFICDVYHHFEYPYDSMASVHKALRKGGRVVLIDFERIPGVSSDWILGHMRAGQEVFEEEIVESGFRKVEEVEGLLEDNYMVIFEKVD